MTIRRSPAGRFSRRDALKIGLGGGFVAGGALYSSGANAQDAVEMKIATDVPGDHPHNLALEAWKTEVETETNGRVTCTIFPDAQLGGEEDAARGLKIGSVDATFSSTGVLTPYVPELGLFDLPFFFRDADHLVAAANGPIAEKYNPTIERELAAKILSWGTNGSRNMWNKTRAIVEPADLVGLKMRVQSSKIQQSTYTAFGALPTPIPFVELYTALQTGVVDGADPGVADMLALKVYQVVNYMTRTRHFYIAVPLLVSNKFLERLSPEDAEIVQATGAKVAPNMTSIATAAEDSGVGILEEMGMEVIENENRDAFVEKASVVLQEHAESLGGLEFLESIRDQI